jgi:signal transduction histidine kinase
MFALSDDATNTPYDFLDAVHPEDKVVVGEALQKALTGGEQIPVLEFRLCSGDRTRWFVLQSRTSATRPGSRPASAGCSRHQRADRARLAVERLEERLASLQDDERRRIAQELHDSTAQHLVAAKFNLLTLRKQLPEKLQQLVDEPIARCAKRPRRSAPFTYLLHASQLDEEGICAMLHRYVPGFEHRTGVAVRLRVTERADEMPGELQHALLRITQECLGNIQRHSGATRAAVDLRCIDNLVHLVVCDNGRGMGPEEGERLAERLRLGLGIRDITVRVRPTHCSNCGNCEGRGCAIHVAVPLYLPHPVSAAGHRQPRPRNARRRTRLSGLAPSETLPPARPSRPPDWPGPRCGWE